MRRVAKWTGRAALSVLVLLFLFLVAGFFWLRTSLPTTDGTVTVAGLKAPVEIVRDANGVPHIFARSDLDASFGLGYVHAQDRLLQMELMRRFGAGRLAEIAGPAAVRVDRMARTLGLYRRAAASFKHLRPETQASLKAYAAGVNAYLKSHSGALPPGFALLRFSPEPWKPADSLVWGRLMATRLATNWRSELMRAYMTRKLGAAKVAALFPPEPNNTPATIAGLAVRRADAPNRFDGKFDHLALRELLAAIPGAFRHDGASNAWAIAGKLTRSGKPVLANDPHLMIGTPILWYFVRVETPGGRVTGVTTPGVPSVVLGHNGHIAWGFSTPYIDTDDVFIERVDPKDPTRYLTPEGSQPFKVVREVIRVRGGKPVSLDVRETRHGPVLDGILPKQTRAAIPKGSVLALSAPWLRENETTADAIALLNKARNWTEFKAALRRWTAPPQNITYADTAGNIGIYTPGLLPIRKKGDGYLPVPGDKGEYDWSGFIPFEELPHAFNPAAGRIVNANNRLVGPSYPHFLSREWGDYHRMVRIGRLLDAIPKHDPASSARMQADAVSPMAREMLPLMLKIEPRSPRARAALGLMKGWDGEMDRARPQPLIFMAWMRELNRGLYADELGKLFDFYWSVRPTVVRRMLTVDRGWCDDVTTKATETCEQVSAGALDRALADLGRRYGSDMSGWRWGEAHFAHLRHPMFGIVPVLRDIANLRIAADGGGYTINRAAPFIRDKKYPFAQRHGTGYRAVYDLADLEKSRFMIATGQSGNPLSARYGDFVRRWRDVKYITIAGTRAELRKRSAGTLILRPGDGTQ